MDVCEPLIPDVVKAQSATKQLQLCELSGPTFGFTTQNLAWWWLHGESQNWGVGACLGQYGSWTL